MITAEDSIEIKRSPEEVYGWLSDPQLVMQWIPHMIENDHGGATRPAAGQAFEQVFQTRTGTVSCKGEFTEVREDEFLALSLTRGRTDVECQYILEQTESGTLITQQAVARTKWPLTPVLWLVNPIATRIARRQLRRNLERLKRSCES